MIGQPPGAGNPPSAGPFTISRLDEGPDPDPGLAELKRISTTLTGKPWPAEAEIGGAA